MRLITQQKNIFRVLRSSHEFDMIVCFMFSQKGSHSCLASKFQSFTPARLVNLAYF